MAERARSDIDGSGTIVVVSADTAALTTLTAQLELSGLWGRVVAVSKASETRDRAEMSHAELIIWHCAGGDAGELDDILPLRKNVAPPIVMIGRREGIEQLKSLQPDAILPAHYEFKDLIGVVARFVSLSTPTESGPPISGDRQFDEKNTLHRDLFSRASDAILLVDYETHAIIDANQQAEALYGYDRDELIGMSLLEMVPPEEHVHLWNNTKRLAAGEEAVLRIADRTHIGKDGRAATVTISASVIQHGGRTILQDIVRDETERRQAEQRVRRNEERLKLAVEAADAALIDGDFASDLIYCNDRAATMLGYRPGELPTGIDALIERIHPDDRHGVAAGLEDMRSGAADSFTSEHRERTKSGAYIWVSLALRIVDRDPHGRPTRLVGIQLDITERKKAEERIAHLAMHDPLTGLPNRTMLHEVLQREHARVAREGGRLAILFIDLDNFKDVNDGFGHAAGDVLLRLLGERLRSCVRRNDFIARLGGDEFALVATQTGPSAGFDVIAQKLIKTVGQPFEIHGARVSVGASVGIAVFPDQDVDAERLLIQADTALYAAKKAGRGQHCHYDHAALNGGAAGRV